MHSDNDTVTEKQKAYMQHLLDKGYDLNRLYCSGNTPIFLADQNNQGALMRHRPPYNTQIYRVT